MKKESSRICQTHGYPTSIKHIITECRDTQEAWQKFDIPEHLHDALGPDEDIIQKFVLFTKLTN